MAAHSRKKLDLTGQRYGKLTVLGPAENIGTRTAWHCRCDCGGETVAKTYHLRSGHVTSCGCVPRVTYVDGTCVEMLQANSPRKNNTSGVPGVDRRPDKGTWRATICFKGKRHYLGTYAKWEDAVKARKEAEDRLIAPFLAQFGDPPSVQGGKPSA